jgi:hypothetical protein
VKVSHLHSNLSASRRTHDVRHGPASLAHTAGADLKIIQDQLGHASIVITADTYTSVLPQAQRRAAEATARLVLHAARQDRAKIKRKARRNRPTPPRKTGAPPRTINPAQRETPGQTTQPQEGGTRSVTTHTRPRRGSHRPQQTDHKGRRSSKTADQRPADAARPKGLEPLTF